MFSDTETDQCTVEGLQCLLKVCFKLAMEYHVDGLTTCSQLDNTLEAVINSCFFQEPLTSGFVARWMDQNCNRLIIPIHKFCVHTLTTLYRDLEQHQESKSSCGLELQTPVFEKPEEGSNSLLSLSVAWLLAGCLPSLYSRPQAIPNTTNENEKMEDPAKQLLTSQNFMNKFLSVVPSHWTLLYDSNKDGLGANRFLHHVLGYKGPTLTLIKARDLNKKDQVFCIGSPNEWKETHLYTGTEDSCLIQLQPKFSMVEKGAKILYLNTSIRGYPKGVRVGVDPRNPIVSIDEHFEKFDVYSISSNLMTLEVNINVPI